MEKLRIVFVAMVAFLLVLEGVHGICNVSNDGLMECKPCIQNDNPTDGPTTACCAALQNADFKCLCKYKDSYMLKTMDINSTRAMELPQLCNIPNAPVSCKSGKRGTPIN
ncbi:Bifunctional inhibitor/lipid-transfer protein/seed storage 2S albumin superfamily protein [Rhynchospora pubera]|uniref:Bifunctional inhibitor/lipid-transfer protein/seed storage 2S albumin superfamily protein n=1 Tax=Rhynchospora pubera TaxID=906938 RepID=A0AAV8CT24_9POAL|nr:Bifunctional inhibitor/lipid-transfer protein/seed storage 2S albumin superfamily protein [Rhynchospora pubera]